MGSVIYSMSVSILAQICKRWVKFYLEHRTEASLIGSKTLNYTSSCMSYSSVGCYPSLSSWFSRAPRCPCRWTGSRGPRAPVQSLSPIRPKPSCCITAQSRRTMTTTNPAPQSQRAPPLMTHRGLRVWHLLVHDPSPGNM